LFSTPLKQARFVSLPEWQINDPPHHVPANGMHGNQGFSDHVIIAPDSLLTIRQTKHPNNIAGKEKTA
jgi:hypothetical protein